MFITLKKAQMLTLGAGSVASTAINNPLVVVRPQVDVFVAVGNNPVAVADGAQCHFISSGETIALSVAPGNQIAAIPAVGTSGTVYLSEAV